MRAIFDPTFRYRYRLQRLVGLGRGAVTFCMLNPSTADETTDDPTVRRCIGYARTWDYSILHVVNLFAWRATDPRDLPNDESAIGPENDDHILAAATEASLTVCAWGMHGARLGRGTAVLRLLRDRGVTPHALRVLQRTGDPGHPLYLPADLKPFPMAVA